MFCPGCGKQIDDDSVFCEYCGTHIEPDEEVPSRQQNPSVIPPEPPQEKIVSPEPPQKKKIPLPEPPAPKEARKPEPPVQQGTVPQGNENAKKKPPVLPIAVAVIAVFAAAAILVPGMLKKDTGKTAGQDGEVVSNGGDDLLSLTNEKADNQTKTEETNLQDSANKESGNPEVSEGSGEKIKQQASAYDTSEDGTEADFAWYDEMMNDPGSETAKAYLNAPSITDSEEITGGWKSMTMPTEKSEVDPVKTYEFVKIKVKDDNSMTFVINSAKTTVPEDAWQHSFSSTQLLTGEWNRKDGTGTVHDGGVEVKMERFFELNGHQYGICVYSYTSQLDHRLEEDYMLLVRP